MDQQTKQATPLMKKLGFALLLFLCIFIPFRTPLANLTFEAIKAIPDILILALAVWYVIHIRFRLKFKVQDFIFIGFILFALVSTVFINKLSFTLVIHQTRSIGIFYILYFIIRNFGYGKRELNILCGTLQIVSLPLFVLGLVEKITVKTALFDAAFIVNLYASNLSRVCSMFHNPNTYGLFLVFVIALSLWLKLRYSRKTPLWMYVTLFTALYMTMSRSSILILIPVLAVFFIYALRRHKLLWKKLVVSVLVIAVAAVGIETASAKLSEVYYEKIGEQLLWKEVAKLSENQQLRVVKTVYINPQGEECVGYIFDDITYIDKECITPLSEVGSIVFTRTKQFILTVNGGMLLDDFNALDPATQNALLDGKGDRIDSYRDNVLIQNVHESFKTNTADRFGALTDDKMFSSEGNMRLYSIEMAFKIATEYPIFGSGFGTYGSSAALTWDPPTYTKYRLPTYFYADNQYATVIAETGFVGIAIFLAFLAVVLIQQRKDLFKFICCVIIGWFGIFYNVLEIQIGAFLLWTMLAMNSDESVHIKDIFKKENAPADDLDGGFKAYLTDTVAYFK